MFKKICTYLFLYAFVFSHFFGFFVYADSGSGSLESGENIQKETSPQPSPQGEGAGSGSMEDEKGETNDDSELNSEGQEDTGSGENIEEENVDIFEGKVIFQNPSYVLERDQENLAIYNCDTAKNECKVNFKFEGFLDGKSLTTSKMRCETNFGFQTGKENNCNPTTIVFPKGESSVDYKIILKNDESIFEEGSFVVKNGDVEAGSESAESGEKDPETSSGGQLSDLGSQDETNTGSGNTENEEGEEEVSTGSGETSGDSETSSEGQEAGSGNMSELPEINFEIQSGADFDDQNNIICPERGKGICKVNFDLRNSFGGNFDEKNYACNINFASGASFSDGTDKKCNPGYVDYGSGIFELKVRIYEKANEENFREKDFILKNVDYDIDSGSGSSDAASGSNQGGGETGSGGEDTPSGNTEDGKGNEGDIKDPETSSGGQIKSFEIKYAFQRPTYFVEQEPDFGTGKIVYNCDSSKDECKVNLDFSPTFSGSLKESDFNCEIKFGSGIITGEENKCNPNTVVFGSGETEVNYKIVNKDDETHFATGSFFVKNNLDSEINSEGQTDSNNSNTKEKQNIEKNPKIEIQSGISENLTCDKKECSVNLIYENTNKNLACVWDFGDGNIGNTNIKSCNPGYVKFPSGKHKITLKVYDKNHENNYRQSFLEFENIYTIGKLRAKITLQGKLARYKQLVGNKLTCYGREKCSVNLTGADSDGEIKDWFWDFGNGETFDGKNPKSINFSPGNYTITLTIFDAKGKKSQDRFFVEVFKEKRETKNININLDFLQFLNHYYQDLDFVKRKKFLENKREELRKIIKLYNRKNKTFSTAYGKFLGGKNILLEKKGANIFGLFYKREFVIAVGEDGKFKQKITYDASGKFVLKAYILDEKLGVFDSGKNKVFEINLEDVKNGKRFLEEENNKKDSETSSEGQRSIGGEVVGKEVIKPKIDIQGKIGKNKILEKNKIICLGGKICSVNFDGRKSKGDVVEIVWDFGNGETFIGKNPKSVRYKKIGKYKVTLKLRDKFGEVHEEEFRVEFRKKPKKVRKKRKKKLREKRYGPVSLKIEVQGRIGKNKILSENKLTCIGTCSVNFDGRKSSGSYKKLSWDFGNGEVFIGENPGYIRYKEFGKYTVKLLANDYKGKRFQKEFLVEFIEKGKNEKDPETSSGGQDSLGNRLGSFKKIEKEDILGKKEFGKMDILFIIIILFISGSGGFLILRKYKVI